MKPIKPGTNFHAPVKSDRYICPVIISKSSMSRITYQYLIVNVEIRLLFFLLRTKKKRTVTDEAHIRLEIRLPKYVCSKLSGSNEVVVNSMRIEEATAQEEKARRLRI